MKKSYFPQGGVWLKGNIHSHSTVSDGMFTPKELAELYAARGYDFLSITDHNICMPHDDLDTEGFLLLSGVEHDLEYSPEKCTHMVGLAPAGRRETTYPCRRYSPQELTDQGLADMMREDGQFLSLAHPVWSRMEWEEIDALTGFHAIEVLNNGMEHLCHGGEAEALWELLLRHGRRVFATAVDDVHVPEDLFGGWVWVKAAERSPGAILAALSAGAYFATAGPVIEDFGLDGDTAYLACSPCREIHFITYPPRGKSFFAEAGGPLLRSARYAMTGRETYVRAVCTDAEGRRAWSNPIFFDGRE